MGISYNPSIVTEDLVLGLDPQSPRFYNYKGRSVAFDGTGDYLSIADSADFDLGTDDFTIEGWAYLLNTSGTQSFVCKGTGTDNQASYAIQHTGTNWVYYLSGNGSTWSIASAVVMGAASANGWYHIALVRSGSTFTPYINGTAGTTTSSSTSLHNSNKSFTIGSNDIATHLITGNISNVRVVKGTALYTSNFTPPTEPLTAVTNTKLLTCQGTTITDASSSAHSITPNGNAVIHYNGPFSGSGWTDLMNNGNSGTLTNGPVFIPGGPFNNSGGSVYFDDTSKYLDISSSSDFAYGTGDFTWECWVYIIQGGYALDHGSNGGSIVLSHTSVSRYYNTTVGTGSVLYTTGFGTIPAETWTHIAAVRSGGTTYLYTNGVLSSSASDSHNYGSQAVRIGQYGGGGSNYFGGYISNLRIVKGTAVYTSNFTPPTGPLEAIDDTALLTCQGGAITDNGPSSHAITVTGDAEAITASAFELDGTNDCVDVTNNANLYPGTGDFTAEVWCRGETAASDYYYLLSNYGNSGSNYYGWWVSTQSNGSGIIAGMASGSGATSVSISNTTVNLNDSNWHHVVFVRSGNAIRLYHNGEQLESDGDVTGYNVTSSEAKFRIGKVRDAADPNGGYYFWNGKISGVKIYKGKGLTEDEVKRNFSALRGRYGI